MLNRRNANERGHFQNDWLNSHHSFSFGEYYDAKHMGVSVLRVINDDRVNAGAGFPTHPHSDMEIVSYVLEGELAHKDSMGNGSVIRPGDVQRMSAGSGVTHSEYNPSNDIDTHFLQIWLIPNQRGVEPSYAQQFFSPEEKEGKLKLLVSPDGREGSIQANSDALMFGTLLDENQSVTHTLSNTRLGYVHIAKGQAQVNNQHLVAGDGVTITNESQITLSGIDNADVLLFDLPQ